MNVNEPQREPEYVKQARAEFERMVDKAAAILHRVTTEHKGGQFVAVEDSVPVETPPETWRNREPLL